MNTAQYISEGYFLDGSDQARRNTERILNIPGVYTFGSPEKGIVAVYIKISDFAIELLRQIQTQSAFTAPFVLSLLQHPGDNVLVFIVIADGIHSMRELYREFLKEHNPDSILWVDRDSTFLHIYQRIHHGQEKGI